MDPQADLALLERLGNKNIVDNSSLKENDRAHEIEVKTDWAALLDTSAPELVAEKLGEHEIWLIPNLFSEEECKALLSESEKLGFGGTHYPKHYRGNLRLLTTDQSLANAVWHRLRPIVPQILQMPHVKGDWEPIGLNECWRLAKYYPGDRFMGHCDANFTRRRDVEESMFTVNVYMNDGFEGGSTRFYLNKDNERRPDVSVVPRTGLCLLFRQPPGQSYYHDGEQLGTGVKYLFRSDVMYRKTQNGKEEFDSDRD